MLAYDHTCSGDFAPLRFVPKDRTVVLGIMSSKRPEVEPKVAIKRRTDEAARFVPLNQLTETDQLTKLARTVEVAREVWGD